MSRAALNPAEAALARLLNRRLRDVISPAELSPAQITGIYTVFGFGALYLSDVYLPQVIQNSAQVAQLQALKGGAEVLLTAGVILILTTRSRQAINAQNDRLDELRAERNLLHRVFRHNLRQDINVIKGYSDLIRQHTDEAELHGYCEQVIDRVARMERYQSKIVDIERLLEPPTTLERIDLAERITANPYLRTVQDSDAIDVTTDLPETAPVVTTPLIESAFEEVLENAVEHNTADDPVVRISIEENSNGLVDLVVEDNGPGISEYERLSIETMQEEDLTHSSGLGLWLAKLTCSISGGRFDIPEQFEGGGKVVMELPEPPEHTIRRRVKAVTD